MKKAFKKKNFELNKITIYRLGDSGMLKARGGLPYTESDCNDPTIILDDTINSFCCLPSGPTPPPTREDPVCRPSPDSVLLY